MSPRWVLVEAHPGSTAGGIAVDADEWEMCRAWTRRGADRIARRYGCYVVPAARWDAERGEVLS